MVKLSEQTGAQTNRIIRAIRWIRLLTHIGVALIAVGLLFPRVSVQRRAAITGWWARKLLRILNILLSVHGARPAKAARKLIVTANHISWVDIFVINAAMLSLTARWSSSLDVKDFWTALWASLVISVVMSILRGLFKKPRKF